MLVFISDLEGINTNTPPTALVWFGLVWLVGWFGLVWFGLVCLVWFGLVFKLDFEGAVALGGVWLDQHCRLSSPGASGRL